MFFTFIENDMCVCVFVRPASIHDPTICARYSGFVSQRCPREESVHHTHTSDARIVWRAKRTMVAPREWPGSIHADKASKRIMWADYDICFWERI